MTISIFDFVEIDGVGIGKVKEKFGNSFVIVIADKKYYRSLDDMEDVKKSTEKEYINYVKALVKQLTEQSKQRRKQAAEYNKFTNGAAVSRKGKVSVINNNIVIPIENALSSHHRELLADAKKMKVIVNDLKKEIAIYKEKEKILRRV